MNRGQLAVIVAIFAVKLLNFVAIHGIQLKQLVCGIFDFSVWRFRIDLFQRKVHVARRFVCSYLPLIPFQISAPKISIHKFQSLPCYSFVE